MNLKSDSEVELRWYAPQNPDLEVANAARVSYGKQKQELDEKDTKLINYLAKHKHMSPFRHVQFSFRIKTPEFVARQFYKHQIGCHYTSQDSFKDHGWNEVSGRYVEVSDDFFIPNVFRGQDPNNKQKGSGEIHPFVQEDLKNHDYKQMIKDAYDNYQYLIKNGVCREQARAIVPLAFYTEFIWTTSLEAVVHFIRLRDHEGAQEEIRDVAKSIYENIKDKAPISVAALLENK